VDQSVNTSSAHVCAFCEIKSLCKNAKCATYTLFVAQTVTINVATTGDFSLDLGFSCFIWGSGGFIENLGLFDSGQILEMYLVLVYFPFKNTVVS